jgi:Reverse transcriptase (RNA-dependent DNA polymerase).
LEEILVFMPLHPNQHTYQAGKTVESALQQLVVWVGKALDQQETALGVFLDIERGFNNTSSDSICAALAKHGVNYNRTTDRATLEGQLAVASLDGSSTSAEMSRSCPQGGVLSLLLWCLVVDDLIARLHGGGVYT